MRNQEFPLLALLLSLVFFISIPCLARNHKQLCHPSSCGDVRDIHHPFRLKGDPVGCGDPDFELSCVGNQTILLLQNMEFYVKEINYTSGDLRIIDVELANGKCPFPHNHQTTLQIQQDERFCLDYDYIINFIICSQVVGPENLYFGSESENLFVPCASTSNERAYVTNGSDVSELKSSCRYVASVPVTTDFYDTSEYFSSLAGVQRLLANGVNYKWSEKRQGCKISISVCVFQCLKNAIRYHFISIFSNGDKNQCYPGLSYSSSICKIFGIGLYFFVCLIDNCEVYNARATITLLAILGVGVAYFLILLGLACRLIMVPFTILVFLLKTSREMLFSLDNVEKFLRFQEKLGPIRYTYPEIQAMTSNFREKLGQGGFGAVYKGKLLGGHLIAVKMLGNSKCNGDEFISEVSTIGRIHHVNIVKLIGFCSEGTKRALVYEYMPNGSLDKYIFSSKGPSHPFSWEKLKEIASGTARGIEYLHTGCDMCILHFDIKPHNILLDHNFIPKVSDFGLAKLYPKEHNHASVSAARGTIGYIAPELVSRSFGTISYKSDVYSFGMVLMEMAGGRRNVDPNAGSSQVYFPSWVYDQLNSAVEETGEIECVPEIKGIGRKLCMVGLWCIQMRPDDRPSMSRVIEMLEGDVDALQMPRKPFTSSSNQTPGDLQRTGFLSELSVIDETYGSSFINNE